MRNVLVFSSLLLCGGVLSQVLPAFLGERFHALHQWIHWLTTISLAYIMIRVGQETSVDKSRKSAYRTDYFVAMATATLPWLLVAGYFLWMLSGTSEPLLHGLRQSLLAGRFAAPTSAGLLFTMLAASGVGACWTIEKARTLAIFDDIDTVVLMVPLKLMMIGLAWQLGIMLAIVAVLLVVAWRHMEMIDVVLTWRRTLAMAIAVAAGCELLHFTSSLLNARFPIAIEVLLPAFCLGCLFKAEPTKAISPASNTVEDRANHVISVLFMLLVGLSLPQLSVGSGHEHTAIEWNWLAILGHALAVTVLSNLGKMVPWFCYRAESDNRQRLALAVCMWPRGEVGAGVILVSVGYGVGGPVIAVATISLTINLLLTGVFIWWVRRLLTESATRTLSTTANVVA